MLTGKQVAVEGCLHGELDRVYQTIKEAEEHGGMKVDLLLCCGDFQAVRNPADLTSMAVKAKYRELGTFHQYYSGEKKAYVPTIVIGGNHEASAHMVELPEGGGFKVP